MSRIKSGLRNRPQEHYNGHSFGVGAATTAASKGVEDSIIKTPGRWEITAYLGYVKIPREQLISCTRILEKLQPIYSMPETVVHDVLGGGRREYVQLSSDFLAQMHEGGLLPPA